MERHKYIKGKSIKVQNIGLCMRPVPIRKINVTRNRQKPVSRRKRDCQVHCPADTESEKGQDVRACRTAPARPEGAVWGRSAGPGGREAEPCSSAHRHAVPQELPAGGEEDPVAALPTCSCTCTSTTLTASRPAGFRLTSTPATSTSTTLSLSSALSTPRSWSHW